jgi:predicted CopG family antitoxin
MGVKTISLKDEAYERLRGARRYPAESFSEVVLRAAWPEDSVTGAQLLNALKARPRLTDAEIADIEWLKKHDKPPVDKWAGR